MRNLKRVLSLAIAAVMLMGMMIVGASAANVSDFKDADQIGNLEAASIVTGLGVFAGDTSGNFNPKQPVTRAEMATIICKILYGANVNGDNFKGTGSFADARTYQGGWAEGYINLCQSQGIVNGYNSTTFGAGDTVKTWQAALMLQRALGYWNTAAGETINELTVTGKSTDLGLYGDLTLSANADLNREDVAELVFNALFAQRVHYDDVRGLYTKDNDRNVVVNNGTQDEMNTLAQNTFGLYSVDGLVTENGCTNMYLAGKTEVVFDDEKDVTGDNKVEADYSFDYETGLDFIGHAVTVYYRIERKAPVVYTIVDQAEKVEVATVGSNFSTVARNAGFSRDTSKTAIVYNYDLENSKVSSFASYAGKPVILIANSSDLTVDYAIIVDQELDYVNRIRVNTADRDNPITTYTMEVLNSKTDDTDVIALNDIDEDQYVLTVKIEDRGINGADLYVIKAAETEQETITKVVRRVTTTTGLSSAGVDYDKSAAGVNAALESLSENKITPYAKVESRGEYVLVFDDFFHDLIGVYELSETKTVNYAYVAQFGHKINTEGSLNDKYALTAHIYFADGTNGIYTVDTSNFPGNAFYGRVGNNYERWLPGTTAETNGTSGVAISDADNGLNEVKGYNDRNGKKADGTGTNNTNYGVYGDTADHSCIGLYNVTILDNGKAQIRRIDTVTNAETNAGYFTTMRKGVTYLGANGGTYLYGNSGTVFFFVDGKYAENVPGNGLTVSVVTGMTDIPTPSTNAPKANWANSGTNDLSAEASDDYKVAEAYTTAKTGYVAVDAALIGGYRLAAESGSTIYFYNGVYTILKNGDTWDLDINVYNAVTGEADTISYTRYRSDKAAIRTFMETYARGYYRDSGNRDNPLALVAAVSNENTSLGTTNGNQDGTLDGTKVYAVDGTFAYFTKQGDILTMYTDKNTLAYGVTATKAEIVDLTGNRISTLQDLSDLIEARTDVYMNSVEGAAKYATLDCQTALLSYSYGNTNNQADVVYITSVIPAYSKDYTGSGPAEEGVENEAAARAVTMAGNNVTVNYVDGVDIPSELAAAELAKLGYTMTKYVSVSTPKTVTAIRNGVEVTFGLTETAWYTVKVDTTLIGYRNGTTGISGVDLTGNADKGDRFISREMTSGAWGAWAIDSSAATNNETIAATAKHIEIKTGYVAISAYTPGLTGFTVTYQLNNETPVATMPTFARKSDVIKVIAKATTELDYSANNTSGSVTVSGAVLDTTAGDAITKTSDTALVVVAGKKIAINTGFTISYTIASATGSITVPTATYVAPTGP